MYRLSKLGVQASGEREISTPMSGVTSCLHHAYILRIKEEGRKFGKTVLRRRFNRESTVSGLENISIAELYSQTMLDWK